MHISRHVTSYHSACDIIRYRYVVTNQSTFYSPDKLYAETLYQLAVRCHDVELVGQVQFGELSSSNVTNFQKSTASVRKTKQWIVVAHIMRSRLRDRPYHKVDWHHSLSPEPSYCLYSI